MFSLSHKACIKGNFTQWIGIGVWTTYDVFIPVSLDSGPLHIYCTENKNRIFTFNAVEQAVLFHSLPKSFIAHKKKFT